MTASRFSVISLTLIVFSAMNALIAFNLNIPGDLSVELISEPRRLLKSRTGSFGEGVVQQQISPPDRLRRPTVKSGMARKTQRSEPTQKLFHFIDLPASDLSGTKINRTRSSSSYKSGASDGRIIYFLHIHKSGGTCMCRAARENKMAAAPTNCNPQKDQRCCGGNDTLLAQQEFARSTNLTFVASERQMYEAMDTKHYQYVLLLRQSEARYRSHWQHVNRDYMGVFTFAKWWRRQPDNWSFRSICGTRCLHVPKFKINESLYNYTLDRLLQFEHILFLEDFYNSFVVFARQVGWTRFPVQVRRHSQQFLYPKFGSGEWDTRMSALDDAIYEISVKLFNGESDLQLTTVAQQKVDEYFSLGPRANCQNPCCHIACSQY